MRSNLSPDAPTHPVEGAAAHYGTSESAEVVTRGGEMPDRGSNTHESIMINIKSPRLRGRPNLLTTSALIAEIKFISFIMRCAMQNVK